MRPIINKLFATFRILYPFISLPDDISPNSLVRSSTNFAESCLVLYAICFSLIAVILVLKSLFLTSVIVSGILLSISVAFALRAAAVVTEPVTIGNLFSFSVIFVF